MAEPAQFDGGPDVPRPPIGGRRVDLHRIETLAAPADTRHSTLHWLQTYEPPFFASTPIP
jgi:hypothetical protein